MLHKDFTVSEQQPYKPEVLQASKFTRLLLVGAQGNEKAHWAFLGKNLLLTLVQQKKKKKKLYLVFFKEQATIVSLFTSSISRI